jgi:F0F1-type ATP synthase membrane subunit a
VFTNISDLVPWWLPGPVIPLIMLALLVSTVQAFVFSMLSTVYIGLAMPHHDSGDAHGHDAH